MVKNFFRWLTKVMLSFWREFVSIPNKHEAMLSNVYWLFNLNGTVEERLERDREQRIQRTVYNHKSLVYRHSRAIGRCIDRKFRSSSPSSSKKRRFFWWRRLENGGNTYRFQFCCGEGWRDDASSILPSVVFQDGQTMFKRSRSVVQSLRWEAAVKINDW